MFCCPATKEYHGWPAGGKLGLQTMYCQQGGATKCPSWVALRLNNISNAPLSIGADGEVKSDALLERGLTVAERQTQVEYFESDEVKKLLSQVASGDVQLTFSYEPVGVGTSVGRY